MERATATVSFVTYKNADENVSREDFEQTRQVDEAIKTTKKKKEAKIE